MFITITLTGIVVSLCAVSFNTSFKEGSEGCEEGFHFLVVCKILAAGLGNAMIGWAQLTFVWAEGAFDFSRFDFLEIVRAMRANVPFCATMVALRV